MEEKINVKNLAEAIDYQEGSIVSKTLIKKDSGTVTIFAFDKGQGLSEHVTPFDAMVQILDGESEITIAGSTVISKKGQMVIMPANKPHALKATNRFKMMLVMIKS